MFIRFNQYQREYPLRYEGASPADWQVQVLDYKGKFSGDFLLQLVLYSPKQCRFICQVEGEEKHAFTYGSALLVS